MKDLVYGNLPKENLKFLKMNNVFTKYFDEFSNIDIPDYSATTEEIQIIINKMKSLDSSSNKEKVQKFIFECDTDLTFVLKSNLKKIGIPFNEEYIKYLVEVGEQVGGLIMQLKDHYQRPRPYQLAWYSKQNLHPHETISGQSPSFPSGHATQGKFLSLLITQHYPEKAIELRKMSENISESRILLGVHYPSDNKAGERIAKSLFAKKEIQKFLK